MTPMADDAPAANDNAPKSGGSFGSLLFHNKRMSKDTFWAYIWAALAVDLIFGWWCPFAGDAFMCFCMGMWWLAGYNTGPVLGWKKIAALIAGVFPIIELVACVLFVTSSYAENLKNTTLVGAAVSAAEGRGVPKEESTPTTAPAANDNTPQGGEAKTSGGKGASAANDNHPQLAGDKNIDGIVPPPTAANDAPNNKVGAEAVPEKNTATDRIYEPRVPLFRQPRPSEDTASAANDAAPSEPAANDSGGGEDYFDNVRAA